MAKLDDVNEDVLFPVGEDAGDKADYFSGKSFLTSLVSDPDVDVGVSNVTFAPGSVNNWHIHHDGYQILLVTRGEGWYQEDGKKAEFLQAGDVVVIHGGLKHWHGAAKDSWFEHVAVNAGKIEWLEPVSDAEYERLSQ